MTITERVEGLIASIRSTISFYYKKEKVNGELKTEYESLQQVYRATGRAPEKLSNPPTITPEFSHIWAWFEDLIDCRESSFGISSLQPPVIQSYFDLMWITASPDEVWVLRLIDKIFIEIIAGDEKK